jgi:hypothetical protein
MSTANTFQSLAPMIKKQYVDKKPRFKKLKEKLSNG